MPRIAARRVSGSRKQRAVGHGRPSDAISLVPVAALVLPQHRSRVGIECVQVVVVGSEVSDAVGNRRTIKRVIDVPPDANSHFNAPVRAFSAYAVPLLPLPTYTMPL